MRKRLYFNLRHKRRSIQTRIVVMIIVFIALVAAVLLTYRHFIERYAKSVVANSITRLVENQSNGRYAVSYDSIALEVSKSTIYLHNLKLGIRADSLRSNKEEKIFETTAEDLELNVNGLWSLWLNDVLTINSVSINRPMVKITAKRKQKKEKLARETGGLLKQLDDYLDQLNISSLKINNATINFYEEDLNKDNLIFVIPNLSMDLEDFTWDVDEVIEDVETNKFSLKLTDQEFIFPDSAALVQVNEITYSLKENRLTLSNVKLKPKIKSGIFADSSSIKLEQLYFAGIDLDEIYENNVLIIDSIQLDGPKVNPKSSFNFLSDVVQRKDTNKSIIDSLFVRDLKLSRGQLNINFTDVPISIERWDSDIINVSLGGDESGTLSYKHAEVQLTNGIGKLKKQNHHFSFDALSYSTQDQNLKLDSLKIWSDTNLRVSQAYRIRADIPSMNIDGLDEQEALGEYLNLESISLSNPSIEIEQVNTIDTVKKASRNMPSIYIGALLLDKATVDMKTKSGEISLSKGSIDLFNLRLNESLPIIDSSTVYSAYLPLVSYSTKRAKISALNVRGSSQSKIVKTSRISFKDASTDVVINQLVVANSVEWLKTQSDSLKFDFISFKNYAVNLKQSQKTDKKDNKLPVIQIDSLNAPNGSFSTQLTLKRELSTSIDSVTIVNLTLNESNTEINEYRLTASNLELTDERLQLKADKIYTNSNKESLLLKDLVFKQHLEGVHDLITSPNISLSNFSMKKFPEEVENMNWGSLTLNNLEWNRTGNTLANKKRSTAKQSLSLPNITLDNIKIVAGNYRSTANKTVQALTNINLEFKDIDLSRDKNWFASNPNELLYARDLSLRADSLIYQNSNTQVQGINLEMSKNVKLDNFSYVKISPDSIDLSASSISLKNVAYNKFIQNKLFEASDLIIDNPNLNAAFKASASGTSSLSKLAVDVKNVKINNAAIELTTNDNENLKLSPIHLKLKGLYYDSLTDLAKTLIPAEAIDLNTGDLNFTTSDGLNEIRVGQFSLSNKENDFTIENIEIVPLLGREEYAKAVGIETDWIKSSIPSLTVYGFDFRRMLKERAFIASYVIINKPKVEVYRDKNYIDPYPKKKQLLTSMLRSIESSIDVDSAYVKEAQISYSEIPEKGKNPGTISFERMDVNINNITNLPSKISTDSTLRLHVTSQVMGEVAAEVDFRFYLNSELDKFEVSGNVQPHNMTLFNEFTEDGVFLHIKSGRCRSLNFTAFADDNMSYGSMYFQYNDFKIALVDKQTADTKKFEESIASFVANTFLVKKRNLAIIRLRKGDIYFERNKNKSIFNYLSKLFSSGVASSVGFQNNKRQIRKMTRARMSSSY